MPKLVSSSNTTLSLSYDLFPASPKFRNDFFRRGFSKKKKKTVRVRIIGSAGTYAVPVGPKIWAITTSSWKAESNAIEGKYE